MMYRTAALALVAALTLSAAGTKKLSALLPAEGVVRAVVVFEEGAEPAVVAAIVSGLNLKVIEHPDLLPSQQLVELDASQLTALAKVPEVSRIFPASDELVSGQPVAGCNGPVDETKLLGFYTSTIGSGWDGAGRGTVALTFSVSRITDQLPREVVIETIQRALVEWSRHARISFMYSTIANSRRNLNFLFGSREHGDAYPFDGRGRVLAHTFYPAGVNPEPTAGDLHLDDDETWSVGGDLDLYTVVLHEVGHALGLGHSDRPGTVMYPYYRRLTVLQPDDIAAIQRVYAAPEPPKEEPQTSDASTQIPGSPAPATTPSATPAPQPPTPQPPTPAAGADRTSPVLAIVSPSTPMYSTSAGTVRITGTARDNVGVEEVTWEANGSRGLAAGKASWSFELPLLRGDNAIVVRARDAAGNTTSRLLTITRR